MAPEPDATARSRAPAQGWLIAFFAAVLLLPPLPIQLGSSGPHVAIAIAGFGLLVGLLRLDEWRVAPGPLFWAIGGFLSALFLSIPFALFYSGWAIGLGSFARAALFGIACYVFFYSAYGPPVDSWRVSRLLFLMAAATALVACVDFYFQWPAPAGRAPQLVWLDSGVFHRAQGVFYEASTLGNLCACFLTMAALCLLRAPEEAPVSRSLAWIGVPVLLTALVLSFSRASLVNLAASLVALLWIERERLRGRRASGAAIALLALSGVMVCLVFRDFVWGYLQRLWFSVTQLSSSLDRVLSGRIETWEKLWQLLAGHPWVLVAGVGYKTLPYSGIAGQPLIVDNMYLSLLAETGLIGLACFLALNIVIVRAAWKARRSFHGAWMFAFWIGQMIQMLSGDLLTYWRVIPVYFWVLGQVERAANDECPAD